MKTKNLVCNWEVYVSGGKKLIISNATYCEALEQAEVFGVPFAISQKPLTYRDKETKNEIKFNPIP